jgi:protein-disulfide isomerase
MRSLFPVLILATLLTLTQCVCQSRRAEDAPVTVATTQPTPVDAPAASVTVAPAVLDTKDLDEDETALLVGVLGEQFDPCGSPKSFLEALQNEAPCELAVTVGAFTVDLIQKGLSKRQLTGQLLKELARRSSKAEFNLDGVPVTGSPNAANELVEFIDFQCPYCASVSGAAKELAKQYGVALYVRHLPLTGHHPLAEPAAKAAQAAHLQGKFWEVCAALFAGQAMLSTESIEQIVKDAGLDMERYAKDVASQAVSDHIARDVSDADLAEVDGTPTFFLNGMMIEFDQLEAALKEATGK